MLAMNTLLVAFLGVTSVLATRSLELKLSGPSRVDGVHNLKVLATVVNTGDEPLRLLNDPNGPLSKIPTDTFSLVHKSGLSPDFIGVKVRFIQCLQIALSVFDTPDRRSTFHLLR